MSQLDLLYKENLTKIITQSDITAKCTKGEQVRTVWKEDDGSKTPAYYKSIFGVMNEYDLTKEFPWLTLRDTPGKNKLHAMAAEMIWIYQIASNRKEDFPFKVWDAWFGEDGTLGTSYGYQIKKMTNIAGQNMDQIQALLWKLKNDKNDRAMITSLWNFEEMDRMRLRPCCYQTQWYVDSENRLHMMLYQRSQDMIVAGGWNPSQYALLLHMVAIHSGYEVGSLKHIIADCHVYDRHECMALDMMSREPLPSPILKINPDVKNFYDFRYIDFEFEVDSYKVHPAYDNIPVAE